MVRDTDEVFTQAPYRPSTTHDLPRSPGESDAGHGAGGGGVSRHRTLVLFVAAAVLFGTSFVGIKAAIGAIPPVLFAAFRVDVAAVGVHAVSLGFGESPTQVVWSPTVVAAVLNVGMPATTAAYPVYSALLAEAGPVRGNPVAYAMPIVATLAGWALLGEAISAETVLGFGVILAGFLVVQRESVAGVVGTRVERPTEVE